MSISKIRLKISYLVLSRISDLRVQILDTSIEEGLCNLLRTHIGYRHVYVNKWYVSRLNKGRKCRSVSLIADIIGTTR